MNTYERIRETRKLREMTQTDLAIKCGYADKSMISRIENGKVDIFLGWKSDSILKSVYRGTLDDFETAAAEKATAYFERQFR